MGKIVIHELEVFYRVGVPDAERKQPQRLLVTVEIESDFTAASASDELSRTTDYYAVTQRLLTFGGDREWRLLEKLAVDILEMLRAEFGVVTAMVEIKKFVIPEAKYVAVRLCSAS